MAKDGQREERRSKLMTEMSTGEKREVKARVSGKPPK